MVTEFSRLEQAFAQAMSLEGGSRASFLASLTGSEPDLANRLESMLHADASGVETALRQLAGTDEGGDGSRGQHIGRYRVLGTLGEGGWGVVYLAEQPPPTHRLVAVKVIKPGMDTAAVLSRFTDERQALALMDHPGVVTALDAGSTDQGRPYVVMPLVPGLPITAFCEDQNLAVADRVRLMVLVCRAVEHAHSKGVLHRDLKPGNILVSIVDGVPRPRVIDFGLAKALSQPLTPHTTITLQGQVIGTPEYMSPEQARGLGADVRADVYSLGAILYEVLAGTPPLTPEELRAKGPEHLLRVLADRVPPPPSSRVKDNLPRELDWIALRCLEKEPARRYATVAALADDLERFLEGRRVQAGPPARLYRWWRWSVRHRGAVASALGIAVALMAGGAAALDFSLKEHAARRQTEKVAAFTTSIFANLDPVVAQGRDTELLMLALDKAAERLKTEQLDPDVQAQLAQLLAGTYSTIGEHAKAMPLAEQSLWLMRGLYGTDDPRAVEALRLYVQVGHDKGDRQDEARLAGFSRELRDLVRASRTVSDRDRISALLTANRLGASDWKEEVEVLHGLIQEAETKLGPTDRLTLRVMRRLAQRLNGSPEEASALLAEARRRAARAYGVDDPDVEAGLGTESYCIRMLHADAAAIDFLKDHLPKAQRLLGRFSQPVLIATYNLGCCLMDAGRYDEAAPYVRECVELANHKHGESSVWSSWADANLLLLCLRTGRTAEAQAVDLRLWQLGPRAPDVDAETYRALVLTYDDLGNADTVRRYIEAKKAEDVALGSGLQAEIDKRHAAPGAK